jgi:hypothetical protein
LPSTDHFPEAEASPLPDRPFHDRSKAKVRPVRDDTSTEDEELKDLPPVN